MAGFGRKEIDDTHIHAEDTQLWVDNQQVPNEMAEHAACGHVAVHHYHPWRPFLSVAEALVSKNTLMSMAIDRTYRMRDCGPRNAPNAHVSRRFKQRLPHSLLMTFLKHSRQT